MTLARRDPAADVPRLPIASADVLEGVPAERALSGEERHANGDLITLLRYLGIAGPFTRESPWELRDTDGRHLIHAGGYAAVPFGEAYPPLVAFLREYLERNGQVGLPQQSASAWRAALGTNLVAALAHFAPSHADSRVFFSNSGAEAVETAIKMARAARPGARTFVNFGRAYHGKTHGALALTPNEEYQAPFRPLAPRVVTVPFGDADALEAVLRQHRGDVAAIVVEPVQGEGGVILPPPGFLAHLGELAREHDALVVADEIQTGLGRSGQWFASLADGLEPDIVTLAKPLGGGLVPIGATIARRDIYRALLHGVASKRHSTTFGGGSLAVAVGLRSLELIAQEDLVAKARRDGAYGLERLRRSAERYPRLLADVRGVGMLFAMTLHPVVGRALPGLDADTLDQLGSGLALRALHLGGVHACFSVATNRTVRLTPPLNLPAPLLEALFDRVDRVVARHPRPWMLVARYPLPRLLRFARFAL